MPVLNRRDTRRWLGVALASLLIALSGCLSLARADEQDAPWLAGWGLQRVTKTAGFTPTAADRGTVYDCAGTFTVSLPAVASVGTGYHLVIQCTSGVVTVTASGAERIQQGGSGESSMRLAIGQSAVIESTSTGWTCAATGNFALGRSFRELTSVTTLTPRDAGEYIDCTSGTFTVTLPGASGTFVGWIGVIANRGAGTITVSVPFGGTIYMGAATSGSINLSQGQGVIVFTLGDGNWTATAIGPASPSGSAGGDLSGSYPSPTVAKVNGVALGTMAVTAGKIVAGDGSAISSLTMSGDATIGATGVLTLGSHVVTDAKFRQGAATSVVGRSAGSLGDVADIAASADNQVLRQSGGTVGFGTIDTASIGSGTLAAARMPALTGDVTSSAGGVATTLANTAVTPGSYTNASLTVDAKGRLTAASSGSAGLAALAIGNSTATCANTASWTTILYGSPLSGTLTIPANYFTVGRSLHLTLHATVKTTGTPTLALRTTLDGTLTGSATTMPTIGSFVPVLIDVLYVCSVTGASGTMSVSMTPVMGGTALFGAVNSYTYDTTASHVLNVEAQWSAADPANSIVGDLYALMPAN